MAERPKIKVKTGAPARDPRRRPVRGGKSPAPPHADPSAERVGPRGGKPAAKRANQRPRSEDGGWSPERPPRSGPRRDNPFEQRPAGRGPDGPRGAGPQRDAPRGGPRDAPRDARRDGPPGPRRDNPWDAPRGPRRDGPPGPGTGGFDAPRRRTPPREDLRSPPDDPRFRPQDPRPPRRDGPPDRGFRRDGPPDRGFRPDGPPDRGFRRDGPPDRGPRRDGPPFGPRGQDRDGPRGPYRDGPPPPRRPLPNAGPPPRIPPRTDTPRRAPVESDDPAAEGIRLSKMMSDRGIASRREADEWIEAGWVRVNGRIAILGQRVKDDDRIDIDPAAQQQQARRVTILLNKPLGYVSGQAEDGYEPAIVLVTPGNRWPEDRGLPWQPGHARGVAPAGRLDIDSTGLLVLTQDGRVAKRLIGEDSDVEKEYLVRVEPIETPWPQERIELLQHGLTLDGQVLKPAKVSWANEDQLRFVLREGRKRQIRRMCELVGLKVVALKRVRIGSVVLGKLPVGQWRYLRDDEQF